MVRTTATVENRVLTFTALGACAAAIILAAACYAFAGPAPIVPDSRPNRDEIAVVCEADKAIYAHVWHEQSTMILGVVHKDGKHEAADVVISIKDKKVDKLWHHGVEIPDANAWLSAMNLCDIDAK